MKRRLCIATATLLLAGCAGKMLPGKLYSLNDAAILDFQIQTSYGTGKLTAANPKTGERFEGQYTGTYENGGTTVSRVNTFDPAKAVNRNNTPGQGYNIVSNTAPTKATARGVLIGDKGTTIELFMNIVPGLRPTGHGQGTDNKGAKYQLQF